MKIEGKILISKVWCITDEQEEVQEMTGETSEGVWLDHALDLTSVDSIKPCGVAKGEQGEDRNAVLYFRGNTLFVDVTFDELLPEWIKIKNMEKK